jgi:hypothetical protein
MVNPHLAETMVNLKHAWTALPSLQRLVVLLVVAAFPTTLSTPSSAPEQSRMATIQALVEFHTLAIDDTAFLDTRDKVFIHGHFYSDKPPIPSLMGAAVYAPLHAIGLHLRTDSNLAYYLITLLTVKLFWVLGVIAFWHLLSYTTLEEADRFAASVALGFGSLFFTYSGTFNNHAIAAGCLSIGFLFYLRARFEVRKSANICLAGFFVSLAAIADIPTAVLYAAFFFLIVLEPHLRRSAGLYLLPLLVTVLPGLAITYSIQHSLLPVQIVKSNFVYPGSTWTGTKELSGVAINHVRFLARYAPLMLIGPTRGFILYNPLLVFAMWGFGYSIRHRTAFYREALALGTACGLIVAYYLLMTTNYGGCCYSIRWFVPTLPVLFFFLYPYLGYRAGRIRVVFRALLCLAIVIATVGTANPWPCGRLPFVTSLWSFYYKWF